MNADRETETDYHSIVWNPPSLCDHPPERLSFTGHFPPDAPWQSVFHAFCNWCGSTWTQADNDAPWEALMTRFANGEFGVVSYNDLDIGHKVEWKRQTKYGEIMKDVTGSGNPIFDSPVILKPFD